MAKKKVTKKYLSIKCTFFLVVLLFFIVTTIFCIFYIHNLDQEVQLKFSGEKWKLPAWIYSRPLELYKNQRLSITQMENELKMLNYRKVFDPINPGEYAIKDNKMVIIKRPFYFYDGNEPERPIFLQFNNNRVSVLQDAKTGKPLAFIRMDPIILDRINIGDDGDRILIRLQDVNPIFIKILLSIEDKYFYDHNGINLTSIIRAMIANFRAGRKVQGGSTLTQQFAKNFFLNSQKTLSRKIKEALIALIIDARYEKNQILEAYLNEIYLGQNGSTGIYGFGLASYFYFGLPISELDVDQLAMLVAIVRGPSYYDPWRHKDRVLERRDMILKKIMEEEIISPQEYEQYASKDIVVLPRGKHSYGKTPAYVDLVKREIKQKLGDDILAESGLKIYTSFDPITQKAAEEAITIVSKEFIKKNPDIQMAMVVANWHKGEVISMVGGRDFSKNGMFNRALDAHRPIGSTIKPMVYLTAFQKKNYQLATIVKDSALTVKFGKNQWQPKNFDHKYHGDVFLKDALARSLNIPAVRVGIDAGLDNIVKNLHSVGITQDIKPFPSLILGTLELSPFELTQMFSVYATQGYYKPLTVIRAVVNDKDDLIYKDSGSASKIFSQDDSYLLTQGLISVVENGTARSLGNITKGIKIAGKTGTSDDGKDSWFAGFDNDDSFAIWVGLDSNKPTGYTGSTGALKIFNEYVKIRGANSIKLNQPKGIKEQRFNSNGQAINNNCQEKGSIIVPAKMSSISHIFECDDFSNYNTN